MPQIVQPELQRASQPATTNISTHNSYNDYPDAATVIGFYETESSPLLLSHKGRLLPDGIILADDNQAHTDHLFFLAPSDGENLVRELQHLFAAYTEAQQDLRVDFVAYRNDLVRAFGHQIEKKK